MADKGKSAGQKRGEEALREKFIKFATRFARAMSATFEECDVTAQMASALTLALKDDEMADTIMLKYYEQAKPHFGACSDKDAETLLQIDEGLIAELDMKTKWPILEELESTDVAWDYIIGLNTYARMRYEVSAEMIRCIEEEGHDLARRIERKEVTLETLDMQEIGQRVVDRMAASDKSVIKQANTLLEILNDNPVFRNVLNEIIGKAK